MLDWLERDHDEPANRFDPLQLAAAQLLLATAADAFVSAGRPPRGAALPVRVPTLIAPLAAVAHLAHMARPSEQSATTTRVLDTAVIAAGTAGALAGLLTGGHRGGKRTVATLALASAGLLGLAVDARQRADAEARRRLERRASVVERLVPQRRPRLDHVVVHV